MVQKLRQPRRSKPEHQPRQKTRVGLEREIAQITERIRAVSKIECFRNSPRTRAFASQCALGTSRPGTRALLRFSRTAFHCFHEVRAQTAIHLSLDNWNKEAWNLVELKGEDSTLAAGESIKTEAEWSPLGRAIYSISVGHAFADVQRSDARVGLQTLRAIRAGTNWD